MPLARREFLLGGAAFSTLAAQSEKGKKKPGSAPAPNVLLILADGIGSWMLGCAGNTQIHTPQIDLLAKGGTRFAANFASAPATAASRATLFTGRTQGNPQSDPMLFELLAAAGYNCGFTGKWDTGTDGASQHRCPYWEPSGGLPETITAKALGFLDRQSAGKPFFLTASYGMALEGHAPRYYEMYAKSTFEAMGRDPVSPRAAAGKDKLNDVVANIRKFAAATTALDDQIPALLAKLHERSLRDNTLIVFTSSNGSLLGRHGLWGDGEASNPVNMYEEVAAVPMIWNWPGQVPVESVRNEVVSLYDFAPSLAEAAGAAPPSQARGRSYATLAHGKRLPKKQPWRNVVFGRYRDVSMVRDSRYKLVLRDGGKGPDELFDLNLDAREKVNRYDAPAYISLREQLSRQLAAWSK